MGSEFFIILLWGLVIYSIVRILTNLKTPHEQRKPLTLDQMKRASVAIAIALLVPLFINLVVFAVSPKSDDVTGFVLAVILCVGGLAGGFAARRSTVVGGGVTVGSLIGLVYAIGVRYPHFDPWVQTAIVGVGLIAVTALCYWANGQKDHVDPTKTALTGMKGMVAGIVIFTLAMMFVFTFDSAINPAPKYPSYPSQPTPMYDYKSSTSDSYAYIPESKSPDMTQYNINIDKYRAGQKQHERNTFAVVLIISVIYLIAGILIRSVSAVSAPFVLGGLMNIVYTLIISFDEFGTATKALISGAALIVLIGLAYWKLEGGGHHDKVPAQKPSETPVKDENSVPLT
ncbi:hypothetical protein COT79_03655 [Candidatus Berkelbacteria bacterium CG10_big_fil_rev_8_21_14_0_10_43_14]|uniref:Uncharacterized protein n=1 Tax=Candidatus Berkelbacteria bacterium CG10_big_fil_rev_8_21_14_0_10_43_14 TaxID=1974515 RepID=A0A2M6R7X2_9BACT|nr:MAG: hypothetical protein COT79_03655 [Candidatus Berkelbacteria bacterium CG10_big_fil_rev_8_21_14_0_10_43_14]